MRLAAVWLLIPAGLLLVAAPAVVAAEAVVHCEPPVCSWSVPYADPFADADWTPVWSEVAPHAVRHDRDELSIHVDNTTRDGTFFWVSSPVPAPESGSFSVRLRSSGDLGRFAFLVREYSDGGAPAGDFLAESVFFHVGGPHWSFASWSWTRSAEQATHVRVFLRGEVAAGATASIHFEDPYFGADDTRWRLGSGSDVVAYGPRGEVVLPAPGEYAVRSGDDALTVTLHAPPAPPHVNVSLRASPVLAGGVRYDASDAYAPYRPDLTGDEAFDGAVDGWRLEPFELGPEAALAGLDGRLVLTVPDPSRNASAWATRPFPVVPGEPYRLTWHGGDNGGVVRFELAVVEESGRRHLSIMPPAPSTGASLEFTPLAESVHVQLRAIFAAGEHGEVWFDDLTLRRALQYEWFVGGEMVPGETGPFLDVPVDRSTPAAVSVRVSDGTGTLTEVAAPAVPVPLAGDPRFRLADDRLVARVGDAVFLDASPSLGRPFDALAGARPWALWHPDDVEAPERIDSRVDEHGIRSAIRAGNVSLGGGGYRHITPPPGPLDLVFRYHAEGDVDRVEAHLRFYDRSEAVTKFARVNITGVANTSGVGVLRVPDAPTDPWDVVVALRGVVRDNGTGVVTFTDARLVPRMEYEWTVGGQWAGTDPVLRLESRAQGPLEWGVRVTAPGGAQLTGDGRVAFLDPLRPFPTLGGAIAAAWPADLVDDRVTMHVEGPREAAAAGGAGRAETAGFAAGEYRVVAREPDGGEILLGNGSVVDASGLPAGFAFPPLARAGTVDLALPLPNPDLVRVVLGIRGWTGVEQSVPLTREGDDWHASWTLRRGLPPGAHELELHLEDRHGLTSVVAVGAVTVTAAEGEAAQASWAWPALIIAAGAVWRGSIRRTWRR